MSLSLSTLPVEIRRKIMGYSTKENLIKLAVCNKFWHNEATPMLWKEVSLEWEDLAVDRASCEVINLRHTQKLVLHGIRKQLEEISEMNHGFIFRNLNSYLMTSLTLHELAIPVGSGLIPELLPLLKNLELFDIVGNLDFVTHFKQLCRLNITRYDNGSPITDDLVRKICLIDKLHDLNIRETENLTGKSLEYLGQVQQLRRLSLHIGGHIKGEWISKLSRLKDVVWLDLEHSSADDNLFDCPERNLTALRLLSLEQTKISSRSLSVISAFYNLKHLNLGSNPQIADKSLSHLQKLRNLKYLNLELCDISDHGLVHVSKVISLTSLDLCDCKRITDAGVESIVKLQNLQYLDIGGSSITDKGFVSIPTLRYLGRLSIEGVEVTNKSLKVISKLVYLQELNISYNDCLTDEGLPYLSSLRHLRLLQCYDTPGLSEDALINAGLPINESLWTFSRCWSACDWYHSK